MAEVYRPRHPERTVLYRVLFHHFERFLAEYESRFEKEYGFFRPIVKEVVERYLDCGNPRCGFARIRCPGCGEEQLLMFSCRTRGFCPSCHAKRLEEWCEWMREELLLDVPHRQVVFTIPKMLRPFFKFKRRLRLLSWRHTGFNVHSRVRAKTKKEAERVGKYMIRPVLSLERLSLDEKRAQVSNRYGKEAREMEWLDYLEFIARVTSHIPDKGWAEMIRKVYEVDPMLCPHCGGKMKIIAFLTDYAVVDRIINHLKLTFVADKPPPPHRAYQEVLMAAETPAEYFS